MRGPGFSYAKNLDGSAYVPSLLGFIGKNSVTFTIGDAVRINTSGFADIATAGEGIAGIVAQVVDSDGKAISADSGTLHDYTMASDNQTSDQNEVRIIPAMPNYLFYNDSSGTLATTDLLRYFDLSDEDQVDQSSGTDTATAQVRLIEIDPDGDGDASKGLFQIVESQLAPISIGNSA